MGNIFDIFKAKPENKTVLYEESLDEIFLRDKVTGIYETKDGTFFVVESGFITRVFGGYPLALTYDLRYLTHLARNAVVIGDM